MANRVKFTEESVMCMKRHILAKKIVYEWAKLFEDRNSIQYEDRPDKQAHNGEHT